MPMAKKATMTTTAPRDPILLVVEEAGGVDRRRGKRGDLRLNQR